MEISKYKRFWEIDFLRGIAIILMITYHLLFDLSYFGNYEFNVNSGIFLIIGRSAAVLFLLLVGISLTLSYSKNRIKKQTINLNKKIFLRGFKIFSLGVIITFITWLIFPNNFIIFGILHLIGISIILSIIFFKLNSINSKFNILNLFLGILIIIFGNYLLNFKFQFNWLVWLGFVPKYFTSFDYFPILPWFGFVLIGLFIGNYFYKNYKRQFKFIENPNNKLVNALNYIGKHSLIIYFLHQPILIIILHLLGIISFL